MCATSVPVLPFASAFSLYLPLCVSSILSYFREWIHRYMNFLSVTFFTIYFFNVLEMKRIKGNALLLLISVDLYLNFGNYSRAEVTFEKFLQLFFHMKSWHAFNWTRNERFILEWNNLIFNYVLFLFLSPKAYNCSFHSLD